MVRSAISSGISITAPLSITIWVLGSPSWASITVICGMRERLTQMLALSLVVSFQNHPGNSVVVPDVMLSHKLEPAVIPETLSPKLWKKMPSSS